MTSPRIPRTARASRPAALFAIALGAAAGCSDSVASEPPGSQGDNATADDDDPTPVTRKDAGAKPALKDAAQAHTADPDEAADAGSKTTPADIGSAGAGTYCAAKPVLEKYCTACHDGEGSSGSPMGLTKPEDFLAPAVVSKGQTVAQAVSARTHDTAKPMPPKGVLKGADIAALDAWIAAGTPAGADCVGSSEPTPSADGKVDGWNPAECDEIYQLRSHGIGTAPYSVSPGTEIHPQVSIDAPWGNEKVQAIGFKPFTDNKKVLHHWILNGPGRAFLAGWAPGDDARPPFPKDVGMAMPTGRGAFTLDMHYNSRSEKSTTTDASGVDVCIIRGEHLRKKTAAVTMGFTTIGTLGVLAPAGANNAPVTGTCRVSATQPVHLLTAGPHAHTYARHMKFTVTKKDGTEVVMHDQDFAFGEQGTYPLPGGEVIIESGDVVKTTCYYTNDTTRNITFSESTSGEMCFNFALYYPKGAFSCGGL
jgi:Copper type II ascorbate-dependent monooxygenase, C-terminal domain